MSEHIRQAQCLLQLHYIYLVSDEVSALVDRVHQLPSQLSYSPLSIFVDETSEHDPWLLPRGGGRRLGHHLAGRGGGAVLAEGWSRGGSPCNYESRFTIIIIFVNWSYLEREKEGKLSNVFLV